MKRWLTRNWKNELAFWYHRQKWMLRPDLLFLRDLDHIKIDRPIFIVGLQGGGGTLIARMLRRIPEVVTVSGDHTYWTGADEMHTVMGPYLPVEFSGVLHKTPPHRFFGKTRGWSYACNELVDFYKKDETDFNAVVGKRFRTAIRTCICVHGGNRKVRFLDKSQSFSLKMPLIRKILDGSGARFLGVLRNPYAICWRAAAKSSELRFLDLPLQERVTIAAEHWRNTAAAFWAEQGSSDFCLVRSEDFTSAPARELKRICEHLELPYDDSLLPGANDTIPIGTRRKVKWYPIRTDVNDRYLSDITDESVCTIYDICNDMASRFGYEKPT